MKEAGATDVKLRVLWVPLMVAAVGLYAVALWFGALNQDEGWYLYAGRLVAEGQHPFMDFASTQGPLMAYVYALAQPLVAFWGVAGGRLFTAILGLLAALAAAGLAYRLCRRQTHPSQFWPAYVAGLVTFAFLGLNLYHVYFTTLVKTYSLAALLVVLGFLALEGAMCRSRASVAAGCAFLAAGCFAAAAGVRLSAGILLPVVWLGLVWFWLRSGRRREGVATLVGFLLGGTVVLLSVYGPFIVAAPAAVRFGLLDYHGGRLVEGLPVLLAYKAGFLIRLAGAYFPLIALGVGCWVLRVGRLDRRRHFEAACMSGAQGLRLLVAAVAAVTVVHVVAVFPYDDYQVFMMPLLAVWVGVEFATLLEARAYLVATTDSNPRPPAGRLAFSLSIFCFVLLLHSAASPRLQNWLLAERDRIWWPLRQETALQKLQRAAERVRELAECAALAPNACNTELLLTQDTYLAVEAGMHVPDGMALGPFCYFPDMARRRAERLHVLNRDMLHDVLTTSATPVAAFSGYGLAIRCPEVVELPVDAQTELWDTVTRRYGLAAEIEAFGQADTALRILARQ